MKLVYCLPGKDFTGEFLDSWTMMLLLPPPAGIRGEGIEFVYNREYSSDIYACRNNLVRTHPHTQIKSRREVFDGYTYDYMFWIDSDMQWKGEDILRLLKHDENIVTGIAPLGAHQGTCVGKYREEDGKKVVSYYSMRGVLEEERNEKGLVEIDFCGFGFIAVKKGVMERIGYPWFQTVIHNHEGNQVATSEDIGWCSRAKEHGFTIYADPEVRIGHKKEILYRADHYEYQKN